MRWSGVCDALVVLENRAGAESSGSGMGVVSVPSAHVSICERAWRLRLVAGVIGLSGWLVGCSGSAESADTPEAALAALARATNDQDDDAIKKLVCAENWHEQYTFRSTLAKMAELDPGLADVKYRVRAGEVRDKTDTTATGVLEQLPAQGGPGPDDLSDEAEAALENMAAPLPIWLIREGDVINLVKENDAWVAC